MKLHKALKGILMLCGMGFLLSGCTLSAKDVKLHTKEEMQKIVDERYGDAEFVSVEEDKEANRKTFTYRDKKYGFTYQVTSRPNSVGMDGSTFFYDGATVGFQYEEPFLEYFMQQEKENFARRGIELCDEIKFVQNYRYPTGKKFSLRSKTLLSSPDSYEEDVKYAWERVKSYKEIPEFSQYFKITVYNSEELQYLGTLKEEGFQTAEEERIEYFMSQAEGLGGIQGVQFLRKEKKKVSEVPGLSEQNLYEDRNTVEVYYFSYEGMEYFIVDLWVAQKSDNGGGIFQYYQSYKHYDVSR